MGKEFSSTHPDCHMFSKKTDLNNRRLSVAGRVYAHLADNAAVFGLVVRHLNSFDSYKPPKYIGVTSTSAKRMAVERDAPGINCF